MTKGPQALTVKPATALPAIVYITVILRFLYASNCSLNRLNLWLLFRWFPHGKTAACKKNYQIKLLQRAWHIFLVLCTRFNSFSTEVRNTETIKILMCENEQKPEPHSWKPKAPELEPCSWRRAPEPELCHFYDGFAALKKSTLSPGTYTIHSKIW